MRRLSAAIFILLLGAATVPDAAAQNRSNPFFAEFISSVVDAQDGRTPTVIQDDDDSEDGRRDDEARDRNRERTERGREGVGRGESGRGTVEGRGGSDRARGDGQARRGDDARERTKRGDDARQRSERADDARERTTRGDDARQRSERADDARERTERGDRAESRRDDGGSAAGRTNEGGRRDDVSRTGGKRGQGPAFCRSGEGHPVFGPGWCRDRGFELGSRSHSNARSGNSDEGPWNRRVRGSEGASDDEAKGRPSENSGPLDGGTLGDILGRLVE